MVKKCFVLILTILIAVSLAACAEFPGLNDLMEKEDVNDSQREQFEQSAAARVVEKTEGVEQERMLVTDEDILIAIDYPSVQGQPEISAQLEDYVMSRMREFRHNAETTSGGSNLPEYIMTYKPYSTGDGIVSICFMEQADGEKYVETLSYDLDTSERINFSDVIIPSRDYQKVIDDYTKNSESLDSYENFALTRDGNMVFNFISEAGEFCELTLPLEELYTVLAPEFRVERFGEDAQMGGLAAGIDLPQLELEGNYMAPFSLDGIDPLNDKVVAFTFDDGPSQYTPDLLDSLKAMGVRATFFVVGDRVAEYSDMVKRIYDEGHEIGTHSWDHEIYYTDVTVEEACASIDQCNEAIEKVTGKLALIDRPPGGNITEEIAQQIGREQIMWNVDTEDWKNKDKPDEERVTIIHKNIMDNVQDGSIILMHDLYGPSADAAKVAIYELKEKGYKFVTVSQMMQIAQLRNHDVEYVFGSEFINPMSAKIEETATPTEDINAAE